MRTLKFSFAAMLFLVATSCSQSSKSSDQTSDDMAASDSSGSDTMTAAAKTAKADISGASDSGVTGTVTFADEGNETVKITVDLHHLTPGMHALHLHENGDCSAHDAMSTGGHWNPTNKKHGKRGTGEWHKGDIANIEANANGDASYTDDVQGWTIGGPDSTNIVNHAVIVHSGADDFTSQPSGNAGSRVACGVITESM